MSDRKGWVRRASERIAAMDLGDLFQRERNRLVEAQGGMTAETNRKAAREVERHIGEVICGEMNSGDPPVISGDLPLEERNRVRAGFGLPPLATEELPDCAPMPSVAEQLAKQLEQAKEDLCYGFAGAMAVGPVQRYSIIDDDCGHHYIIPHEKRAEADAYFAAVTTFWEEPPTDENAMEPERPEWLQEIGGALSLLTFASPEIGAGF